MTCSVQKVNVGCVRISVAPTRTPVHATESLSAFGANDEDDILCVPIATYLIDVNKLMLLVLSKIGLD